MSIGNESASTPGTFVGSDGVEGCGVGPATGVGASGGVTSVHELRTRQVTTIQLCRICRTSYPQFADDDWFQLR